MLIEELPRLGDEEQEALDTGYVAMQGVPVGEPAAHVETAALPMCLLDAICDVQATVDRAIGVLAVAVDALGSSTSNEVSAIEAARELLEKASIALNEDELLRATKAAERHTRHPDPKLAQLVALWVELDEDSKSEFVGMARVRARALADRKEGASALEPVTTTPTASTSTEWPFPRVPLSRLYELTRIERAYAERKLLEALAEIEAAAKRSAGTDDKAEPEEPSVYGRIQEQRGEIFAAMAMVEVTRQSINADEDFDRRAVLERAYKDLDAIAWTLDEIAVDAKKRAA